MTCTSLPAAAATDYDVIIVGAGPAGLAVASTAIGRRIRVLMIEAGGRRESRTGRAAYAGQVSDPAVHPRLDMYRVRALGGTSRIWGGRCIPFDPIDFEKRDWIPFSGWPIGFDEVARYYARALELAEAGSPDSSSAQRHFGSDWELVPGLDDDMVRTTLERFSRPTNFWSRCAIALERADNVHVVPHARLIRLATMPSRTRISHIVAADRTGATAQLRASAFVLALGGLETTRMLLVGDERAGGLGNDGGHLGHFYMSHLCTTAATAVFAGEPERIRHLYGRDRDGIYVRRRLWITEAAQRKHQLANVTFRTHLPNPADPVHRNGILSAMFLSKSLVQREYAAKFSERPVPLRDYVHHVANVTRDIRRVTSFGRMWIRERVLADRKLPSVVLDSAANVYPLEFHAEQAPNPASRVRLAPECDRDGVPRLAVDWRLLDSDIAGLQRAHELLGDRLFRTRTGQLHYDPDLLADRTRQLAIVGGHHLGTTRMSSDPRDGVVDTDCRVHGVTNLYVASGSVFPTSGQANPTLTIVALALRLADHLIVKVGQRQTELGRICEPSRARPPSQRDSRPAEPKAPRARFGVAQN